MTDPTHAIHPPADPPRPPGTPGLPGLPGPRVSVLMPAYNAMPFLSRALRSTQAQTERDIEIIVVDDGSTDGSAAILDQAAAGDPRIRLIRRPNTGICAALNEAVAAARSPYLARMDADDWSDPDRLAEQADFLDARPAVVAVGTGLRRIDAQGMPIRDRLQPTAHADIEAVLLSGIAGGLTHATAMIRRETLASMDGPYRLEYQGAEDLDLFLRLGEVGELANLPRVLYHVRMHLGSVTKTDSQRRLFELKRRIVADARRRRGLDAPGPELHHGDRDLSPWQYHLAWARQACPSGFTATARKHARAAVRLRPASAAAWQTLALAHLPAPVLAVAVGICRRLRR